MLNIVEEQTTETDQIELTASDEVENIDSQQSSGGMAKTCCEVIDEVDGEQSSSLCINNSEKFLRNQRQKKASSHRQK